MNEINAKIALDLYRLLTNVSFNEILNISIHKFLKNSIHVYDFNFENFNTCIEYRGSYYTKTTYFNVDGTIFKVFQVIWKG